MADDLDGGKLACAADGVIRLVDGLISRAVECNASDVHFEPTDADLRVRFRVDGSLHEVEQVPASLAANVVARLKVLAGLLTYRVDVPQEGALTVAAAGGGPRGSGGTPSAEPAVQLRVSTFPTIRGERVVMRLLPVAARMPGLEELGHSPRLLERLHAAADGGGGLILVTGPAGSGKTTTLYALLRRVLELRPRSSVVTVEDPVEYTLDGVTQVNVNAARGFTYARALRSLMRQDPEVLLIGEVRDAETAQVACEAALTGHLLLSTLHSGTPAEGVLRLMEMGVPAYQITSTVRLVMAQRLLRTVCADCRAPTGRPDDPFEARRCAACLMTGYRGRTACGELLRMDGQVRRIVLAGGDVEALAAAARADWPDDLASDGMRHVRTGRTTAAELARVLGSRGATARGHAYGAREPGSGGAV